MAETATLKPMLFSPQMVREILYGNKTVTRRVVMPLPDRDGMGWNQRGVPMEKAHKYAKWKPGDILWVRERFTRYLDYTSGEPVWKYAYFADGENRLPLGRDERGREYTVPAQWRPSIHMPKDAARLFLRVTDVRAERIRCISGNLDELGREGFEVLAGTAIATTAYAAYWDSLVKPDDRKTLGWDVNPWVWRIAFERCEKPEGWPGGGA